MTIDGSERCWITIARSSRGTRPCPPASVARCCARRHARHVLPDEDPEPVGPVVPAIGLDLDVLAQHVVAESLGRIDVEPDRGVGRRRVEAVGPVALVQRPDSNTNLPLSRIRVTPSTRPSEIERMPK